MNKSKQGVYADYSLEWSQQSGVNSWVVASRQFVVVVCTSDPCKNVQSRSVVFAYALFVRITFTIGRLILGVGLNLESSACSSADGFHTFIVTVLLEIWATCVFVANSARTSATLLKGNKLFVVVVTWLSRAEINDWSIGTINELVDTHCIH